jgi:alpha-ketoglutarate-dependent taurine dioxygenase
VRIRGYKTNAALSPHCDTADVAALLCVRPAKSGGTNTLASAMAIYNEVLAHHPEYVDPLCRGFHYNIRGEGPKGPFRDITQHRVPVYSYHAGRLSVRFNWKAIKTAEQLPGVPPLTALEHAAVDYVADLSHRADLGFAIGLEAGDLLLLNNYTVLHMRDAFEDYEDRAKRRLLLRLWVNMPNSRPLLPDFADHYNTGPRQGPFVHHHEGDPDFETA